LPEFDVKRPSLSTILILAIIAIPVSAQDPDVIVGALPDLNNYQPAGGFHAYSVGTTSCNIGSSILNWISSTNDHPVIAQQMYRVRDGVFRQIGFAWLKHGFGALQQNLCGTCTPHPNFNALGVGCSDPYGAGLNGQQTSLGPRSDVNPSTGLFPYPFTLTPTVTDTTSARIRVDSSLVTNQPAGARFFVEGHYIAKDDAAAGNGLNNASYRETQAFSNGNMVLLGSTVQQQPAIYGWQAVDPAVGITTHDVPGDGRFILASNVIPLGGGMTRYVFALHNLNSDLAASDISIAMPAGATVTNLEFLDADFHSGAGWASTDWTGSAGSGAVTWSSPDTFASNPNGAALRWSMCHTFVFDADAAPGAVTVGLFKNASSFTFGAAPTPDWAINGSAASLTIDNLTNNGFIGPIQQTLNLGGTATVTYGSNVATSGSAQDIFYQSGSAVPASAGGTTLVDGKIINLDITRPLNQLLGWQPTVSGTLPLTAPNNPISLAAQMAVTDATAFAGFHVSAAVELDVQPCVFGVVSHALGDDDTLEVTVGPGGVHSCVGQIAYHGSVYSSFFINSNGSVSFIQGSTAFAASIPEFLSEMPRIAGNWSDLNPAGGGTINSVSDGGGNLFVQFRNVPPWSFFGTPNQVSFDIGFGANGDVGIGGLGGNWTDDSLTGFSPGGVATGNAVTWSSLVGSTTQYASTDAVYQFVSAGSATGFSSAVLHSNSSITVN